jgi:hypothetical protein
MGRVCVGALLAAAVVGGCGGGGTAVLRAASVDEAAQKISLISTSTPTLLPVSAHSRALNCPFHDRLGGQSGPSFQLR